MGGRAQCAPLHLRQAKRGVVGGDDDIGVADQPDAAADAESVDRGDNRYRAFINRAECGEAAAIGVDKRAESFGALHLFYVHPGVEAAALGAQDDHVGIGAIAGGSNRVGEFEPALRGNGVDGRIVDGHRDYARFSGCGCDRQIGLPSEKQAVAT